MGKFNGHFYPGLYLFSYGLYQTIVISKAIIFNNSLLYPSCPPRNKGRWATLWKISYGGLLKMVTGSILTAYVVICLDDGMVLMSKQVPPRFMYPKEWQHLTMFILLILIGCADITSKNLLPQRCVVLEKSTLVLTFYVLLLLLVSHIQASVGVELQVHSLLILVVFLLVLVLTAELWVPDMFHLWLIETFLFLMMGSWLMHTGFILYRPVTGYTWQDDDMSDIVFVTTFFCWHMMINASCQLVIYGFSSFWYHCFCPGLKLTGSKETQYHASPPGPLYKLLQELEQSEKDDQALLLPTSSL
ncbi:transmembrane epididymal protein 1-like [Trichechus inunguis]|uniref:Transmembrane epididymal protein 1-like n=1 Tax=Trichechus manatus latirostris TaxID=127582 RepID=A0A2Y9DEA5_TRIMA|nr:transmembrane epididymal protein 1-like [Trichechus manatus latirostris]